METTIPFSGFYESKHDGELDNALEYLVQDSRGSQVPELGERIWPEVNYSRIFPEYARTYTECFSTYFAGETGLRVTLEYKLIKSPQEYNFETDRIFAEVSVHDVKLMYSKVNREQLEKLIEEKFTSRSGFISYYASSLEDWPEDVAEWDHNQIGTLIEALMVDFSDHWEWDLIEDWSSNGVVEEMVYSALSDEGKRIVKIADYLRERHDRKYR